MNALEVIKNLGLKPLPEEGGYYRETYRSEGMIRREMLANHGGDRCFKTAIYYLITPEEFSGLHSVKSDEMFHFYRGDPVEMLWIYPNGAHKSIILGSQIELGHTPQLMVPAGVWQGTRLMDGGSWALLGCTVAPGFEFEDFDVRTRKEFTDMFPKLAGILKPYTREKLC